MSHHDCYLLVCFSHVPMLAGDYASKGQKTASEYASKGQQAAGEAYDQTAEQASTSMGNLKAALTSYTEWLKDVTSEVKSSSSKSAQVRLLLTECAGRGCKHRQHDQPQSGRPSPC